MKIVCISDTHSDVYHDQIKIPECDLLIHAGDFTYYGRWTSEVAPFLEWFAAQPAKHKVLIMGNHEVMISKAPGLLVDRCKELGITLLRTEHTVIEGRMIFGTPYSVKFGSWAFGLPDCELQQIWDVVNPLTEILVVHGPPKYTLDKNSFGDFCGSETLFNHIVNHLPNLKLVVCGHIHESRGILVRNGVVFVNAAICGIPYSDLKLEPIVLELE